MPWISERADEIGWNRLEHLMHETVAEARRRICPRPKRVLLLPPDITRMHSGAGRLTEMLYNLFRDGRCRSPRDSDAGPARAAHAGRKSPHVRLDSRRADPSHDWRGGCVHVGEIPGR